MTIAALTFRQICPWVAIAALFLFSSVGWTEVRVIVEYNSHEHKLVEVVELPSDKSAPVSDHIEAKAKAVITPANATTKVKLMWFGADGALIGSELINDPRLTHAPLTGAEFSPTVVGLESGAYMVSGPSESAVLEIHMPANMTLGLDQQIWRLTLVR